jgi:hypothetical protein
MARARREPVPKAGPEILGPRPNEHAHVPGIQRH